MGLEHTFITYRYMQAHAKDMHEYEYLFPNNMIYGNSNSTFVKFVLGNLGDLPNLDLKSQWTCQNGLGKSCHESNMHHHTYHYAHIT